MDYVDQYGPVILGSVAPDRWPAYVALGSVAVPRMPRRSVGAVGGAVAGHGGGGQILVAADCELPGRGFAFHARFAGANDKDSWIDFFRSLAGRPTWIVAERSEALSRAVAEHWPETIFFGCEEHLREGLRAAARADRLPERDRERGPIYDEIRAAFRDLARWEELVQAGEKLPPARSSNLRRWLEDNEALVLAQFFHNRLQARKDHFEHFFGRTAKVGAGVEDDVGGAGQIAEMDGIQQVFAQARPFFLVTVQVDVIGGMHREGHAGLYAGLANEGAGGFADAHAVDPGQLEGVQAKRGGAADAADGPAGVGRGGEGGTDGAKAK